MFPIVCPCQINFSVEKDWITDSTVKQILQNYRPYVIHLNLRGCTSLKWPSLKCISEYCTIGCQIYRHTLSCAVTGTDHVLTVIISQTVKNLIFLYILKTKLTTHKRKTLKNVVSPSDTDCLVTLNERKQSKILGQMCLLESGQPDDLVFLWYSQVAGLELLLQLSLHFHWCVPQFRVRFIWICSTALSVLWALSVIGMHILLHTFPNVFKRGVTQQARVLHSWVQTQPVHHVMNAKKKRNQLLIIIWICLKILQ